MKLAPLLEEARTASPARRIEWRDQIAAFGPRAIEAVGPWLTSPVLGAFAVRVIERAGAAGETTLAAAALRSARATAPPAVAADIDWALQRLRAASPSKGSSDAATAPAKPAKPAKPATPAGSRSLRPRSTARGTH
jgi:hypothetical protein